MSPDLHCIDDVMTNKLLGSLSEQQRVSLQSKRIKVLIFELIHEHLMRWYKEEKGMKEEDNDLSTLKSLKLFFFVVSESANFTVILNEAFSFTALPYGPVELAIYDEILRDNLTYFSITKSSTSRKKDFSTSEIEKALFIEFGAHFARNIVNSIKYSVQSLREKSEFLVYSSAFGLVELSHRWSSWKTYYLEALSKGKRSAQIDKSDIYNETRFYF